MSDEVNDAVVTYLQQHGYQTTAEKFLDETKASSMFKQQVESNSQAEAYSETYQVLHEWISTSLDAFRDELLPVSWAVFVHFYLELLSRGFNQFAVDFRKKHEQDHLHAHHDEVQQLAMIAMKSHVSNNEFAQRALNHKIRVSLSKYSVELLVGFLLDRNLLLALSVVNRRVQICHRQVTTTQAAGQISGLGVRSSMVDGDSNSGIDANVPDAKSDIVNQQPIQWGVLNSMRPSKRTAVTFQHAPPQTDFIKNVVKPLLEWEYRQRQARAAASKEKAAKATEAARETSTNQTADAPLSNGATPDANAKKSDSTAIAGSSTSMDVDAPPKKEIAENATTSPAKPEAPVVTVKKHPVNKNHGIWPTTSFFTFLNVNDMLTCADISDDCSVVAAGFGDSKVMVWDHNNNTHGGAFGIQSKTLVGHAGPVYGCSIARDKRYVATCSEDGSTQLWVNMVSEDQDTAPSVRSLERDSFAWRQMVVYRAAPFAPTWDVKFSPFGYYFATASQDRSARLFCVERNTPLRMFVGHLSDVNCVAWHPNCRYIATGSWDKTARLWDVQSGECVRLFCGHTGSINALTIDPSGRYLATTGKDKLTMMWDLSNGQRISTHAHEGQSWSLSFSHDGGLLAGGGADCAVRVWDAKHFCKQDTSHAKQSRRSVHGDYCRVYPTKHTPVTFVSFKRGNLLTAAGSFNLPQMA